MSLKNNARNKFSIIFFLLLTVIIFFLIFWINKKKNATPLANKDKITVVFYNIENLFDTFDDPQKEDNEFLPNTKKGWNTERYNKKISDLSRVFQSLDKDLPEIIGLAEVENHKVLEDLSHTKKMQAGDYGIVHFESPDHRGIDCALLYKKEAIKIADQSYIRYKNPLEPGYTSRDILYVQGKFANNEVLHIFVNHWPSRRGGLAQTEPRRTAAADILRQRVDELLKKDHQANIIIMGDMNDTPSNKSLYENLGAKELGNNSAKLINLMFEVHNKKKGSYNFRGDWQVLDNLIVSKSMLDTAGYQVQDSMAKVFKTNWMTYTNNLGQSSPNKTYGGPKYYGGISDHFPIFLKLSLN